LEIVVECYSIPRATASINMVPSMITGKNNHPKATIASSVEQSNAVAPAGGWIVFVRPINTDDNPTDKAPAPHFQDSKFGERMEAAKIWPSRAFRGCANGESIVWNSRIAAAPYKVANNSILLS
jgi:hypothetical protein